MNSTAHEKLDKLAGIFERHAKDATHGIELADKGIITRQQQIRELMQENDLTLQLSYFNLQCRKLVDEIHQMQSRRGLYEQEAIVWNNLLAFAKGEGEL